MEKGDTKGKKKSKKTSSRESRKEKPSNARAHTRKMGEGASNSQKKEKPRVVIVPGNGCYPVDDSNWYSAVATALEEKGFECLLENMPDPNRARESIWIPFIQDKLKAGSNTILVGHSSGAEAGMRYAEKRKLKGLVLVSACYTDLGVENERQAGYYSRPWEWKKIRENCEWILQLASNNDPFIPEKEMLHVAKNLDSEYHCLKGRGHFLGWQLPEVVALIEDKLKTEEKE
mmetsp:Transcript_11435/g.15832  ORF Transcript_11435/g.15832 Transcript_11435/m.15832 type:complete len:231 (+) Transcript_11435:75-767(+)